MGVDSAFRRMLRRPDMRRTLRVTSAVVSLIAFAIGVIWLVSSVRAGDPPFEPVIVIAGSVVAGLSWLLARDTGAAASGAGTTPDATSGDGSTRSADADPEPVDREPPPPTPSGADPHAGPAARAPIAITPLLAPTATPVGVSEMAETARALAADPDAAAASLPDIWSDSGGIHRDRTLAVRQVVAGAPEAAGALFLHLLDGPRDGSWWSTCHWAAETLSPAVRTAHTEKRLAALLLDRATVDPDLGRVVVRALGRIGAHQWASAVRDEAEHDGDAAAKLGPYAATALTELALAAPGEASGWSGRLLAAFLSDHPDREEEIGRALANARPKHEALLRDWLGSSDDRRIDLSARAFVHVGVARAASWILDRAGLLGSERSSRLGLYHAAGTLSDTATAARLLVRWDVEAEESSTDLDRGMARCAHLLADDADHARVAAELVGSGDVLVRAALVRGAGLRATPDPWPDVLVDAGRRDDEPSVRGAATLAGARRGSLSARTLREAAAAAARDDERLFCLLGLLTTADEPDAVVPAVSTVLARYRDLPLHGPALDRDIQAALRAPGSAAAARLADDRDWLADAR